MYSCFSVCIFRISGLHFTTLPIAVYIYNRCGNMRKDSGHVVCCFDQSASFRIFDSTFYFPHSAFRNSAFYPHPFPPV